MNPSSRAAPEPAEWAGKLFRRSLTKQAKLRQIIQLLGATEGQVCLDVGGDNGVLSALLRRRGGTWCSLDASEKAVASIRRIVGERVYLYDGSAMPFEDHVFDAVVIIDMLEHLEDDRSFISECHRVLKPAGCLIVNVPHIRRGQILRPLRRLIGLTDERHGHVRPGYSEGELFDVLKDGFDVQEVRTYSRFFVELIDTAVQFAALRVSGGHDRKGVMLDENDYRKMRKAFRLYSLLYPFFWLAAQLDRLLFFTSGYSLIVRAKRRLWIPRTTPVLRDGRSIAEATLRTQIGSASVLADLRKPGRG